MKIIIIGIIVFAAGTMRVAGYFEFNKWQMTVELLGLAILFS